VFAASGRTDIGGCRSALSVLFEKQMAVFDFAGLLESRAQRELTT
jgi:hypothetical protein